MFERYTERARRSIFFARYEASQYGSPYVETEHLLLALWREDEGLRRLAPAEPFRRAVDERVQQHPKTSTSADLPISHQLKRVLAYAAEEAEQIGSRDIVPRHLALGLLREADSLGAQLLREHGVDRDRILSLEPTVVPSPPSGPLAQRLSTIVAHARLQLESANGQVFQHPALAHLIHTGMAHHLVIAQALVSSTVEAVSLPSSASSQYYAALPWHQLTELWLRQQDLLIHLISQLPKSRWNTPCRLGVQPDIPVHQLIEEYATWVERMLPSTA